MKHFSRLKAGFLVFLLLLTLVVIRYYEEIRIGTAFIQQAGPAISEPDKPITEYFDGNKTSFPLTLPSGFQIELYAADVGPARTMRYAPDGSLMVAITKEGKIISLPDRDGNGVADEVITVLDNLDRPHGLAFNCNRGSCTLYVAENDKVSIYDYDIETGQAFNPVKIMDLPASSWHFTRSLQIYQNKLLVSIGSSCNVCKEEDDRYASILQANLDGSDVKPFATGLRNAVFMNLHPVTGALWVTEMGRDLLGDDIPPDEINIVEEGKDYGWPLCYGKQIHDNDFDKKQYVRNPCEDTAPSHLDLQAHSAPLGLDFVPEEGWPEEYWHNLIVAYHGSWNRSIPTGYQLMRFKLDENGNEIERMPLVEGWLLDDETSVGRPADVLISPGGLMYVSDDKANVIYRITYDETRKEISVNLREGQQISSPLTLEGEAVGPWFFEADFPIELRDLEGNVIASAIGRAQGEWMTENFVPFEATLEYEGSGKGHVVLKRDNPSGLPEHDAELSIAVEY